MIKKFCFSLVLAHAVCMPAIADSITLQHSSKSETHSAALPTNSNDNDNQAHKEKNSETLFVADAQITQYRLSPSNIWLTLVNFTAGLLSGLHGKNFRPIYHIPLIALLNTCLEGAFRLAPTDNNSPPAKSMAETVTTHLFTYHRGLLVGYVARYLGS